MRRFPQAAAFRVGDKDGRGGLSKLEAQATIQDHFQQHGSAKDAPTLEYIGSLFETFDFDRSGAETALSHICSFVFLSRACPEPVLAAHDIAFVFLRLAVRERMGQPVPNDLATSPERRRALGCESAPNFTRSCLS